MSSLSFNRFTAWAGLFLLWALIYLPGLGRPEVQSNEPKRMIPAEQMLVSGDWTTPELYGEKYYKKPPLINWMIALSYRTCGEINEFAARLPSVLMVLTAVSMIVLLKSTWFPLPGRFCAAIIYLTTYAVIESGRLCEIEATLMSLTAMAATWWLYTWIDRRSPWLVWTVPGIILGAGMLLKGPIILLFFYPMVLSAAYYSRRWKDLRHPAHFLGLLIMLALFFAWAWPGFQAAHANTAALHSTLPHSEASTTWRTELLQQINPSKINFGNWFKQIAMGIAGFFPWLPLVLLLRLKPANQLDEPQRLAFKTTLATIVICFIIFNVMPGTRARYSAPLAFFLAFAGGLVLNAPGIITWFDRYRQGISRGLKIFFIVIAAVTPLAWILLSKGAADTVFKALKVSPSMPLIPLSVVGIIALFMLTLTGHKLSIFIGRQPLQPRALIVPAAMAVTCVTMFYSVITLPVVAQFDIKRPAMLPINRAAAEPLPIYVYRDDSPFLFYLRRPVTYIVNPQKLPDAEVYVFVSEEALPELQPRLNSLQRKTQTVAETIYKKDRFFLLKLAR